MDKKKNYPSSLYLLPVKKSKKKKVAYDQNYILTRTKFSGLQGMFSIGRTE